ncbi:MAG: S1C family serine protease [Gaiellales bacterium]|jgi:S1-C subfamily serine protease|nr:trypsin-like peptidase domain-containing protein [Gaiellales bacterium]
MTSILKSAALIAAAVFSGGVTAVWVDSTHPQGTTIVRTETIAAPQNVNSTASTGLSVNQIYRRAGLGVGVVRTDQGLGTGFVIDSAGHVLTNAHVVLNANDVQVELPKTLGSGEVNTFKAKVLGLDKSTDVAVLQIDAPADQLHPLTLAPSGERPQVGQSVVAIGTPLGEEGTVTTGIVSAVSREINSLDSRIKIYGAIQTDAAINHGNSGGPLIDGQGQVIGINSQILSENNGNVGIGFAIPISTARDVADQIISTGKVAHTWLGIEGTELTPDVAKALNLNVQSGVIVGQVVDGSPAAKAGLKGGTTPVTVDGQSLMSGGDVIVKIDGTDINTFADLAQTIAQKKPGETIPIEILRNGQTQTVNVTLGER